MGAVIAALVFLLAASAVMRAEEPENPYTSGIDARMGQRSYQSRCTSCHGPT